MSRDIVPYLKTHRSAILGTIVLLQNSGLLSEKAANLLDLVGRVLTGI